MRVLSTLAVQGLLQDLGASLAREAGAEIAFVFEPTTLLLKRLRAAEPADVAILTAEGIDTLAREGHLADGSRIDVAVSEVGIAVRAGASKPDISTEDAVRTLLREVPSLCYSKAGASGIFFAKVLDRLGLAEAVARKATVIPSGFTAEQVANGTCEIAIQQLSELMQVPGVEIVGPLPDPIQERLTFSAALVTRAAEPDAARRFLRAITKPELALLYRRHGLIQAAA